MYTVRQVHLTSKVATVHDMGSKDYLFLCQISLLLLTWNFIIVFKNIQKKKSKCHLNEITASYVFLISPGRYRARNKHLRQEIQNCTKLRLLYRQT